MPDGASPTTADLRAQEEDKFKLWPQEGFNKDGLVDPETFHKAPVKILLLLKEVNTHVQPDGDLRGFLARGAQVDDRIPPTWRTLTRWIEAIQTRSMPDLSPVTPDRARKALRQVCAVNLKKTPGGSSSDDGAVLAAARTHRVALKGQLDLYRPNYTLCCGPVVGRAVNQWNLIPLVDPQPFPAANGVVRRRTVHHGTLIELFHPAARKSRHELLSQLLGAITDLPEPR